MWEARMYSAVPKGSFPWAGSLSSGGLDGVPAATLYHTGRVIRPTNRRRPPTIRPRSLTGALWLRPRARPGGAGGLAAQVRAPLVFALDHQRVAEELVHAGHVRPRPTALQERRERGLVDG